MKINFSKSRTKRNQRGSVLIMCLVLAGVGTIGVAAWAALLDARTHEAEQNATALERRIRFGNSKALAREVLYRNYLHASSGPAALEEYTLSGGWGRTTIASFAEAPLGFTTKTRINKTGAVPFRAFSLDVDVGVDDGDFLHPFTYQLKSYSPLLGGDLLYMHKNVATGNEKLEATGDLRVEGRGVFWKGDYKITNQTSRTDAALTAGAVVPKLALTDTSDASILPSNFPFYMQTGGAVGGSADLLGRINVVDNPDTPSNSYWAKVQSYGTGNYIVIDGQAVVGSGEGPDTNPAILDETIVQSILAAGGYSPANLVPYAPLSTEALEFIANDPSITPAEAVQILQDSQPIPDDVLDDVISSPTFTAAQEALLLEGANFHAYAENGTVVVNLNSPSLPHVLVVNAGKLEILGQPDDISAAAREDDEPRIIAVRNDSAVELRTLSFRDQNKLRVMLALHNNGTAGNHVMNVAFAGASAFPEWHMLMDLEGLRSKWDTSAVGGVRIFGGIRTDQLVNAVSGQLALRKQTKTDTLETMASRAAWIETIRN